LRIILAIIKKELKAYFSSPIAYVIMTVFLFIIGFYFFALIQRFSEMTWAMRAQQQYQQFGMQNLNINEEVVRPFFSIILTLSLFIMPILTMRLFSEEMETGTLELLLTSPVTEIQLIGGKYLASVIFYLFMILFTVPHMLILFNLTKPDIGTVLSGYGGLILVGLTFLAIGLFLSSLTKNQIVAAVLSFGVLLLLGIVSWASNFSDPTTGKVLSYLSIFAHFEDFSKGVFDTKHLIYYLSFSFGGLFLTYTSLDSLKWRG
jgi:ABC-2 type transport system permease protein